MRLRKIGPKQAVEAHVQDLSKMCDCQIRPKQAVKSDVLDPRGVKGRRPCLTDRRYVEEDVVEDDVEDVGDCGATENNSRRRFYRFHPP